MVLPALLVALGLAAAQAAGDPGRYVPTTGWSDDERAARFYERWYGDQLKAMGEKPLVRLRDRTRRNFRLLVLPNNHPGYSVGVDLAEDGGARLRWTRLDGAGGYAPGNIAEQGSRLLLPRERRRLVAALDAAALAGRPREHIEEGITANSDGSQTLTMCFHATHIVFEHVDASGRRFLQREECWVEEPLQRLWRVARDLADLRTAPWRGR